MIIRRKHTANYTTIGNALFTDERLAADEVGILAFLLSRPNDWEVRRPALMRRWKVGREAMKRIMTNWMRTGWCRAEKTRLPNGTFHIIYEIRDEPGPTLSDEQVRRALSLVSSEAADGHSDGDLGPQDHPPPTDPPPTGQPPLADQPLASRTWPIEDSLSTESPRKDSAATAPARETGSVIPYWSLWTQILDRIGTTIDDPNWAGRHGRVAQWLVNGWDADLDILPTIERLMARRRERGESQPRGIGFFEEAIADAHRSRLAPVPQGRASTPQSFRPNTGGFAAVLLQKHQEGK